MAVWCRFYLDCAPETRIITYNAGTPACDVLLEFIHHTVEVFGGLAEAQSDEHRLPELLLALPLGAKDNAGDAAHFAEQEPENASPVSEADRIIISPFLAEIERYEVYELSEIEELLDQIPGKENPEVRKWVVEMRKAIYSCNEEIYRELLDAARI